MTPFISKMIKKQADKSIEAGQKKYRAYFIKTTLYLDYKDDVDTILRVDGYEDCIVER